LLLIFFLPYSSCRHLLLVTGFVQCIGLGRYHGLSDMAVVVTGVRPLDRYTKDCDQPYDLDASQELEEELTQYIASYLAPFCKQKYTYIIPKFQTNLKH